MKTRYGMTLITVVAFSALLIAGFFVQQSVTTSAFDKLEVKQVSEHAQRVNVALDYETQLLQNYGATNSIWDSSYDDVANANADSFNADFVPGDLQGLFGFDGVVGVDMEGHATVGGLVENSSFKPLPDALNQSSVLQSLWDPNANAGAARCGAVNTGGAFLYCGFPSYHSDSSGPVAGGLVFFKSLDKAGLAALGKRSGLAIVPSFVSSGGKAPHTIESRFGPMSVSTKPIDDKQIALDVSVPVTKGAPIVLEVPRDRPIHQEAGKTTKRLAMLVGGLGLSMLFVVLVVQKQVVSGRVRKLRQTVGRIQLSDSTQRVQMSGGDEIGLLAKSINEMLEHISTQQAEIAQSEASQRIAHDNAAELVRSTSTQVLDQLANVVAEVERVRSAAGTIDQRADVASSMTAEVAGRTQDADAAVRALDESTKRISQLTKFITDIAGQTNMLALNATIEAARAGDAGRGFAVVASEVKNLASMTAASTVDINGAIKMIQDDANAVAAVFEQIMSAISNISSIADEISGATGGQRDSVDELSRQVGESMNKISAMTETRDTPSADSRFGVRPDSSIVKNRVEVR